MIDAGSQPSSRENVGDGAAWLRAFLKRSRSANRQATISRRLARAPTINFKTGLSPLRVSTLGRSA